MSDIKKISATVFSRKFSEMRDIVNASGVIEVEAHGRTIGAFLSPAEYSEYQKFKELSGSHYEITPEFAETEEGGNILDMISRSEYGEEPK